MRLAFCATGRKTRQFEEETLTKGQQSIIMGLTAKGENWWPIDNLITIFMKR